jgi:hypothetical protein
MKHKSIDLSGVLGFLGTGQASRAGVGKAVTVGQPSPAAEPRVKQKSLKPYFDDIVAGEATQPVKNSELVVAAACGDLALVRELVASGAEIHVSHDEPLQVAAANGHAETVEYLLEQKADPTADDNEALIEAAKGGYHDVVALLLDHGANVHARKDEPLRLASQFHIQTPGSFNARRRTPPDGHAKTIKLLHRAAVRA